MRIADYPDNSGMTTVNDAPGRSPAGTENASRFSSDRLREGSLLLQLGIGKPLIARMMFLAEEHGTSVEEEMLASGEIEEATYFEALAEKLGLPFLPEIDGRQVQDIAGLDTQILRPEVLRLHHARQAPVTVIVPTLSRLGRLKERLRQTPGLAESLAVSMPSTVRRAAWQAGEDRRVAAAVQTLFDTMPLHSARITFWGRQGFYTGVLICVFLASVIVLPLISLLVLHVILTSFYLVHFLIRLYALLHAFKRRKSHRMRVVAEPDSALLPVYSILVPLYKEAGVANQLVQALDRLDWPRSRLDIKLVCEADDRDTIAALTAQHLAPEYEIVIVPVRHPRTKPKALSYALAGVRGAFVAVYDAEDRPSPGQLREAHAAFQKAPEHVVCLQAPLIVTNASQSWLSALFAMEYAGLFRGLLPMLSSAGLPLPLGGTSNHFRTGPLKQAGGWDPYNVTEDADLGLRFHRLGYRSRVISQPTFEDAPVAVPVWLAQRTRWFKGWLQTWLVLMRQPARLVGEMGLLGFGVFQVLIAGMLVSALFHPVILAFIAYLSFLMLQETAHGDGRLAFWLFIFDVVNIFGSYAVFIALGRNPMNRAERRAVGWRWVCVPYYWLVMSLAAWKALVELHTNPFSWSKTPHVPVVRKSIYLEKTSWSG